MCTVRGLLRGYLDKAKHERELPLAQQRSFHRLLTYIDQQLKDLHECSLKGCPARVSAWKKAIPAYYLSTIPLIKTIDTT